MSSDDKPAAESRQEPSMIYFWVAVGGAIGSMARLWLGVKVTLLTGLAFPWGTILVNIIGSLVIGFVATLTGPNGRVAVPVNAQAFVMVGLCGGFTTFSAFSLQTLELARDGRLMHAGANIMLSVVLCLTAVAFGHWLAALFGRA
jgi:fluoride exporter